MRTRIAEVRVIRGDDAAVSQELGDFIDGDIGECVDVFDRRIAMVRVFQKDIYFFKCGFVCLVAIEAAIDLVP